MGSSAAFIPLRPSLSTLLIKLNIFYLFSQNEFVLETLFCIRNEEEDISDWLNSSISNLEHYNYSK